jgi:hypothetical protein
MNVVFILAETNNCGYSLTLRLLTSRTAVSGSYASSRHNQVNEPLLDTQRNFLAFFEPHKLIVSMGRVS